MNMTTGEKIQIEEVLDPYEATHIKYTFHVPFEKKKVAVHVFKLHLIDPSTGEKFGDPMTAVCSVIDNKADKNDRKQTSEQKFADDSGQKNDIAK